MASIRIPHSSQNLIFAAYVANETGARFHETDGFTTISIEDTRALTIPRHCFDQAFNPHGRRRDLEDVWASLLLNKEGHLIYFGDTEILLCDTPELPPGDPDTEV
jgi:hypothetical protein